MLDQYFCEALEYKLCEIIAELKSEKGRGFWCDGVFLPKHGGDYSQITITEHREVKLSAFIGRDGQEVFSLTLHLGRRAVSRYKRELSILECIPQKDVQDWFKIDTSTKEIDIRLD